MSQNDHMHGGNHYKRMAIEPWDYVAANELGYFEGEAIGYISRWKIKNGIEDLRKAGHFIAKLIEVENARAAGYQPKLPLLTPPDELLVSMAMRFRHDFGLLEDYQRAALIAQMRQVYEEVIGTGFYSDETTANYTQHLPPKGA